MKTEDYLELVGEVIQVYLGPHDTLTDVYLSKFDGSYITHVGMENHVDFLAEKEITEELTAGHGFSPKDNKWYGWSHRAIYGFEIGSVCSKGDCHYNGEDLPAQEADAIAFWTDECYSEVRSEGLIEKDGELFFDIRWTYSDEIPNKKIRNTVGGVHHHVVALGRGEWVAETMEDARQMALDFKEGVS
ncbi:MAG: hypothetical protein DRP85_03135 [Candidatus Makaraimicrobium thalassicum]|nr:MAG: hypothetical protein DRP85_03135 [Candidatus Omnitrophota bacterium]